MKRRRTPSLLTDRRHFRHDDISSKVQKGDIIDVLKERSGFTEDADNYQSFHNPLLMKLKVSFGNKKTSSTARNTRSEEARASDIDDVLGAKSQKVSETEQGFNVRT